MKTISQASAGHTPLQGVHTGCGCVHVSGWMCVCVPVCVSECIICVYVVVGGCTMNNPTQHQVDTCREKKNVF